MLKYRRVVGKENKKYEGGGGTIFSSENQLDSWIPRIVASVLRKGHSSTQAVKLEILVSFKKFNGSISLKRTIFMFISK